MLTRRHTLLGLALVVGLTMLVPVASAQRGGFPRGFDPRRIFEGTMPELNLLRYPAVVEEIGFTEEQSQKYRQIQEERGQQIRQMFQEFRNRGRDDEGNRNASRDPRQAVGARNLRQAGVAPTQDPRAQMMQQFQVMGERMQESQKEIEERIMDLLESSQIDRLREIWLQQEGWSAVFRPAVAEALNLTKTQRARLDNLRESYDERRGQMRSSFFQAMRSQFESGRDNSRTVGGSRTGGVDQTRPGVGRGGFPNAGGVRGGSGGFPNGGGRPNGPVPGFGPGGFPNGGQPGGAAQARGGRQGNDRGEQLSREERRERAREQREEFERRMENDPEFRARIEAQREQQSQMRDRYEESTDVLDEQLEEQIRKILTSKQETKLISFAGEPFDLTLLERSGRGRGRGNDDNDDDDNGRQNRRRR